MEPGVGGGSGGGDGANGQPRNATGTPASCNDPAMPLAA
jgi:hypothetical protein